MTIERFSFHQWLLEKREQFVTFTLEEIASVAIMSGYSEKEVMEWMGKKDRRHI